MSKLPKMTPIESTNIAATGVHGSDLFLRFKGGGVYRYAGAGHLHADMLKAESKGSFFHREVKGKYAHSKLDA